VHALPALSRPYTKGRNVAGWILKILIIGVLAVSTIGAYGGAFYGWFLPKALDTPVSLRDGSPRPGTHGRYFTGGRSHVGGGYRGGK